MTFVLPYTGGDHNLSSGTQGTLYLSGMEILRFLFRLQTFCHQYSGGKIILIQEVIIAGASWFSNGLSLNGTSPSLAEPDRLL